MLLLPEIVYLQHDDTIQGMEIGEPAVAADSGMV